jgi:hypothetical protein
MIAASGSPATRTWLGVRHRILFAALDTIGIVDYVPRSSSDSTEEGRPHEQAPARVSSILPQDQNAARARGQRRARRRTNAAYLDETVAWSNPAFLLPPIPRRRLASARADAAGVGWARSRPSPTGLSSHASRVGRLVRWVSVSLLCQRARRLGGREDPGQHG